MRKIYLVLLVLSFLIGCYSTRYKTELPRSGYQKEKTASFFLFGLVGRPEYNLDQLCPNGVSQFRNYMTFLDGFLRVITIGIYTPTTIEIECSPEKISSELNKNSTFKLKVLL